MLAMISLEEVLVVLVVFAGVVLGGGLALYAVVRRAARDGVRDAAQDAASNTKRE
jgi:hypothetical protein